MTGSGASSLREQWRHLAEFGNRYMVSERGNVRNCSTGKLLFGERDSDGYRRVNLTVGDGKATKRRVHRLVCEAFSGPCPEGMECAHLDGNPANNNASNLKWVTRSENSKHKGLHGRPYGGPPPILPGESNPNARLTAQQVAEIRLRVSDGEKPGKVAAAYGISYGHVWNITRGRAWQEESCDAE